MESCLASALGGASTQEDYCLASQVDGFYLLADGLGVKGGGALAASLAGDYLLAWCREKKSLWDAARANPQKENIQIAKDALLEGFQKASAGIFQAAQKDGSLHGMCSGVDLLLPLGNFILLAHVGAGRVYLVRNQEAHLLTEDHTQLAYLRRLGKLQNLSSQELASNSKRLTRAVGHQETVKVDILPVEVQEKDRLVIMTDGVWQTLGEATTLSMLTSVLSAEELLKKIHSQVEDTGSKDNYSTLIFEPSNPSVGALADDSNGAEQKIKMLGKVPAFEYLTYQELIQLVGQGELFKVKAGDVICKEGDPGDEMMLILQGDLVVSKGGKTIRRLGKGDVFGEMGMIDQAPRSATITTATAASLLAFSRDTIFRLIREDSRLGVKLLWGISLELNKRLRTVSNKLVGISENEGAAPKANGPLPF